MKCSLGISNFLEEISSLSHSVVFLFLCIDHLGRLSCLSLLFFGTVRLDGYIFPFLLCHSLVFFSQLFTRPPQTAVLPFCISFSRGWFWSPPSVQCYEPLAQIAQHHLSGKGRIDGIRSIRSISIQWRQWHPTPVLLPGKSHGRRSLVGCSPWGR